MTHAPSTQREGGHPQATTRVAHPTLSRSTAARSVSEMAVLGCDSPRQVTVIDTTSSCSATASSNLSTTAQREAPGGQRGAAGVTSAWAHVLLHLCQHTRNVSLRRCHLQAVRAGHFRPQLSDSLEEVGSILEPARVTRLSMIIIRATAAARKRPHAAKPATRDVGHVRAGSLERARLLVLHRPLLAVVREAARGACRHERRVAAVPSAPARER